MLRHSRNFLVIIRNPRKIKMLSLVNLEKIKERRKILRILGRSLNQLDVMKVSNLVTLELSVLVIKKKKNL